MGDDLPAALRSKRDPSVITPVPESPEEDFLLLHSLGIGGCKSATKSARWVAQKPPDFIHQIRPFHSQQVLRGLIEGLRSAPCSASSLFVVKLCACLKGNPSTVEAAWLAPLRGLHAPAHWRTQLRDVYLPHRLSRFLTESWSSWHLVFKLQTVCCAFFFFLLFTHCLEPGSNHTIWTCGIDYDTMSRSAGICTVSLFNITVIVGYMTPEQRERLRGHVRQCTLSDWWSGCVNTHTYLSIDCWFCRLNQRKE